MKKLRTLSAILSIVALVSCSSQKKDTLYLFNWSYYIPDDVLHDFKKETGIKVVLDTYDSNESMYAKLRTGNARYDIVVPSSDYVELLQREGMLAPIQREKLTNLSYIDDDILAMLTFDRDQEWSAPYFIGATGINVNRGRVGEQDASWSIFASESLRGRMTMMNDMRESLGAALAYHGFSINSTNPEEIAIAKNTLLKWKKNLLKFDAEMFGKDFASGSVAVAHGYAEVVLTELEEADGIDYQYLLPREGGVIYVDSLVILANSENQENAHIFINYLLRPDIHARIADTFYYPVLTEEAQRLRQKQSAYEIKDALALGYEVKRDLGDKNMLYTQAWSEVLKN
ncbi:extracellular solute-binding protein [Entomospira entomophila]|uniref:Extracellular solute-binding protein n=1 Tax=Entomospira entomophila TaxID=2719988 RepID=A0A968KSA0_9SPIO|nr:extracellular solute-binding protein [Entomospira entomophilus]NIZ40127.1 extracellular solute-binding protein [Entomospira entomophilus]WDI35686.1 extracellular solute-binding protein [Entomospira entomophilus]